MFRQLAAVSLSLIKATFSRSESHSMSKLAITSAFLISFCTTVPLATAALQQATATFSQSPQDYYAVDLAIDGVNDPQRGWR